MCKFIEQQLKYNKILWLIHIIIGYIGWNIYKDKLPELPEIKNFVEIGILYFAGLAYDTYRKQAEITDTSNLMTTWCEHNRIMDSINNTSNKNKPLKYFEFLMFFERICGLYYTEWERNERIKKEFHVLYDATIDANCRKHFEESFRFLYEQRGRFIYEYDLTNVVRYLNEIESERRNNIKHILDEEEFNINAILSKLENLYEEKKNIKNIFKKYTKYHGNFKPCRLCTYKKNLQIQVKK